MENFGWKGLLDTLWQRVFKSWVSTLAGVGLAALDVAVTYLLDVKLPTWAHVLVGLVSSALTFYKSRQQVVGSKG